MMVCPIRLAVTGSLGDGVHSGHPRADVWAGGTAVAPVQRRSKGPSSGGGSTWHERRDVWPHGPAAVTPRPVGNRDELSRVSDVERCLDEQTEDVDGEPTA